jgi:predicted secreted protein
MRHWVSYLLILSVLVIESTRLPEGHAGERDQAKETLLAVIVTMPDNEREVTLQSGGSMIVRLEAIPGTGYGWQLVRNGSPQLQLEGPARFEPRSNVEAGGVEDEVFRFRAQMTGIAEIEFHYRRPWDKQGPAAKTFTIRIIVE